VTAMRHVLQAPVEEWSNRGERLGRRNLPDGVWEAPDGQVAIEYDASGYPSAAGIAKAWVSERNSERRVRGAATPARVAERGVLAPWWDWRGAPPAGVGPMLRNAVWK